MKKHGVAWWIFIGWWWYLCFAWWLYPIKWLLFGRKSKSGSGDSFQLLHETETAILDALKKYDNGTALQANIKNSLSGNMKPYFDEAVHELYQNGKIKTSKDGSRVRLELV